jgi:phenylalanyl-tRNA synthetase beta chain
MAGGLRARELYNYALYDESFLNQLGFKPENAVALANPVSQNFRHLVTSLIPQLIRAVVHAGAHHDEIRFFEWARTWQRDEREVHEKKSLAGIIYHKKEAVDFYWAKDQLQELFTLLGIEVVWQASHGLPAWYHPYKTATLVCGGSVIGYAGNAAPAFLHKAIEGHAFIFELSGDMLLTQEQQKRTFQPLSKYQDSFFDVSMFCPFELSVEQVIDAVKAVNPKIVSVILVDFFEKKEWGDKRSLTVRVVVQDHHKTLVKEEIDAVHERVLYVLKKHGVEIR